jgi:23S rRNA pseudouridine1911/1915/1917 synthase
VDSIGKLEVLFEDNHCLAVCKPSRLLTASDKSGDTSLYDMVVQYRTDTAREGTKGYIAPIHFLDRPVSGIVLYAKSSKAASRISEQFRNRKIRKYYEAIVHGAVADRKVTLEDYLIKDKDTNITKVGRKSDIDAKICRLTRALKLRGKNLSWVEIEPETGRSHQIRVQLSYAGNSIFGDTKYGSKQSLNGQILLHATRLEFTHPVTKEVITVTSQVPELWHQIWNQDQKE